MVQIICIRCRCDPCRCRRQGDPVIELGNEIGRIRCMHMRLRDIAPALAKWYETPKADRVGPRPSIPREHITEVEQLLGQLLR